MESMMRSLALAALLGVAAAQLEWRGSVYCELWVVEPAATPGFSTLTVLLAGNPAAQCNEALYANITDAEVFAVFTNATQVFRNGPREWIYNDLINAQVDPPPPVFVFNMVPFIPVAFSTLPSQTLQAILLGLTAYIASPVTRGGTALWDGGETQYRLVDSANNVTWQMQALSKLEAFAPANPGFDTLEVLGDLLAPTLPPNFEYEVLRGVPGIVVPPGPTFVLQDSFFNTYIVIEDDIPDCECKKLDKKKWDKNDEYTLDYACEEHDRRALYLRESDVRRELTNGNKCAPLLEGGVCESGFDACRIRTPLK
eukprot:scaffold2538_cov235-Pinguiococcus_pyrenoidosus.AAC.3